MRDIIEAQGKLYKLLSKIEDDAERLAHDLAWDDKMLDLGESFRNYLRDMASGIEGAVHDAIRDADQVVCDLEEYAEAHETREDITIAVLDVDRGIRDWGELVEIARAA